MRVIVDYRPALRERSGAGEYVHYLVQAFTRHRAAVGDDVVLFSSSWKDRPSPQLAADLGASVVDRRVPVRVLNYLWHRREWPPIEAFVGPADVVHAGHPLLIPTRQAAQVITIHDLFFLAHPERTSAEIRRDYPLLAARHARRADAIVVPSRYTAELVRATFSVPADRIHVCAPGAPAWTTLGGKPNVPVEGYVLFVGTLEPRKNVPALLDAYERVLLRGRRTPDLVLAGRAGAGSDAWLDRLARAPLAGHVRHLGYVPVDDRERLYAGARLLVLPSRDEGFGLPVLEAMSAGVPVLAADRGSLPEVIGDAGVLVDPDDSDAFARALVDMLDDQEHARAWAERGLCRAGDFSWAGAAAAVRVAYESAIQRKRNNDRA